MSARGRTASRSLIAAGRRNSLARQPPGAIGGQEHRNPRDVLWLTKPPKRRLRDHLLFKVASSEPNPMGAFGFHPSGSDGIHPDFPCPEFLGKPARNRIDSALGRRVHDRVR
jgi:hypothetical protein